MFVLGDIWIRPSVTGQFLSNDPLGVYLQVYNATFDQASMAPAVKVTFQIFKDGQPIRTVVDEKGESLQSFSGQRMVIIKAMSLKDLEAGKYKLEVKVQDEVGHQTASATADFRVEQPRDQLAKSN